MQGCNSYLYLGDRKIAWSDPGSYPASETRRSGTAAISRKCRKREGLKARCRVSFAGPSLKRILGAYESLVVT
jgi:hypothetical protein